jgi:hypothetical protein
LGFPDPLYSELDVPNVGHRAARIRGDIGPESTSYRLDVKIIGASRRRRLSQCRATIAPTSHCTVANGSMGNQKKLYQDPEIVDFVVQTAPPRSKTNRERWGGEVPHLFQWVLVWGGRLDHPNRRFPCWGEVDFSEYGLPQFGFPQNTRQARLYVSPGRWTSCWPSASRRC